MEIKSWRNLDNSRKQADLCVGCGMGQQGGKSLHPFFLILVFFYHFFLTPIPQDPLIL